MMEDWDWLHELKMAALAGVLVVGVALVCIFTLAMFG